MGRGSSGKQSRADDDVAGGDRRAGGSKPLGPWRQRHRSDGQRSDRKRGKFFTVLPFALLFVVFPGNMLEASHDAARELSIVRVGEATTATVTGTHRVSHHRGATTVYPDAVYTIDGRTYRHTFRKYTVPLRDEPDVGDRFQIIYDPSDPTRAAVSTQVGEFRAEANWRWFVFWLSVVVAGAEIAWRLLLLTLRLLSRRRSAHSARFGRAA